MTNILTGRCLCGSIEYEVTGSTDPITMCHCKQCRQWGGHAWASLTTRLGNLVILKGAEKLRWFESSDLARRGFCSECGSSLFWHGDRHELWKEEIAVAAGSVDDLGDHKLTKHIFTASKGDYYQIADGLLQEED